MSESKLKLSREDVHEFVRAMTAEMQTPSFFEKLREAVKQEPIPTSESELMAVFEGLQVEFLTRYEATRKCGENEQQEKQDNATIPDGNAILQELREAVLHYPDKETEGMIRQMCMLQESQMLSVCASTPSLAPLVQPRGDGCQHAHCHGHGHSHGAPDAQQMMEMQMAIQSLSPQLRQDMTRIQQTIHSGQQPSGEDVLKMREIQSHIKAFITTLRQFNAGNAATKK
ncbi:hypothetical protein C3747_206g11 [Trypanosoma cruzi]|uniref:Uncharacterized protein n=2 Tax=Trypanosoma cruzi TaxID=5693 RepID=Q4DIR7_TRYCC|nr:hypothetical protein, conserved [Trypanosoma cruzi]EAN92419.1 hypothetical protein, conserved [Trypanosoma cruzi]PWV00468.1 hypothetical protein C3747_206g11 [Trypanosoma cruzi]RNC37641.1 hypothetical protein TcCL_NonESM13187 [Trypanosoma cruzi]|eukprot:XP_814270.1 hypothetical protein [Trypanosoma cruzi strain CL Brener]